MDSSSNVYVAGYSYATWNGPSSEAPLHAHSTGYDIAVLKLNSAGAYQWHTFYGSASDFSMGSSIAVDSGSNICVAGADNITWIGNTARITLIKLSGAGAYQWQTFYHSAGDDLADAVAIDSDSNIYAAGYSSATWNGPAGQSPLNAYTSNFDMVILKMQDPTGASTAKIPSASVATSLGLVSFSTDGGSISGLTNISSDSLPCSSGGYIFPFGMFSYNITSLAAGQSVNVTIKVPVPIPMGSKIFKCQNGSLVDFSQYAQQTDQYTFVVTLRDGGQGDADGKANGTIVDPCGPAFLFSNPPQSSSAQVTTASQSPVAMANISVQSASLSTARVAPGAPITVTANVANKGTANGSAQVKLYVNGQEEGHQGVTLASGKSVPVKFTVSRDEMGTYSVYVGSVPAGSFTVDSFADPNLVLYISGACLLFAFILGAIYIAKRKTR